MFEEYTFDRESFLDKLRKSSYNREQLYEISLFIPDELILEFYQYLSFRALAQRTDLSLATLRKFRNFFNNRDWIFISQWISVEWIIEFKYKVSFAAISCRTDLKDYQHLKEYFTPKQWRKVRENNGSVNIVQRVINYIQRI